MPDIALRFNKDMLVLSTPIDYQLKAQGFDGPGDREYVALCEPDLIEEAYKLESIMETPCFVTATEGITRAHLAFSRFEKQAGEIARIAYEVASEFKPQHIIAAIAPTGLPLDPSMESSVNQSIDQYGQACRELGKYPFDAIFFSGFTNLVDAQCALRGAHENFEGPVFITLVPDEAGNLQNEVSLAEAAAECEALGADVIGVHSGADPKSLGEFVRSIKQVTFLPILVDFEIRNSGRRLLEPTPEIPYPTSDALFTAACVLQQEGVQFFRASGSATPAYTGALCAAVLGNDVKVG